MSATTIRVESRLAVSRPAPEVFDYICEVGRWPEWAPTVKKGWVTGGGPLEPGVQVEQRAKLPFGITRHRAQRVTAVNGPHDLAFAGPFGTATARWGMEFTPLDEDESLAEMWFEGDLKSLMRLLPSGALKKRVQDVMDIEMVLIKAGAEALPVRSPA
jgi:hypothetical protein